MRIKKIFIYTIILLLIFLYSSGDSFSEPLYGFIKILNEGRPRAVIVTDAENKESARFLSNYLKKVTGAVFPVYCSPTGSQPITIFIKNYDNGNPNKMSGLYKSDGYSITFPTERAIVISGNSLLGVQFGVFDFLERYLGVRWLFPGTLGEHLPSLKSVDIPKKNIYENPEFLSRRLSGLKEEQERLWAHRNRMHDSGIHFHHNLFAVLPPSKFAKSNPEFYPIINGKRFIPGPDVKSKWQPCFSAQGSVHAAAKVIVAYFSEHPESFSFSLGVNDRGGFCECETCQRRIGKKVNFLGQADHSELYYSWANAVVAEVLKKSPNKIFGCLAYSSVASPPVSFTLHPNITPFLTSDRLKWLNPDMESREKNINQLWANKASALGWYDYIYGKSYLAPRVYFHHMSEYLRYAAENDVKFFYSEAYPNWGEGPKLYLALRLQWNPYIDVNEVLNDWYNAAVGEDAAPYLAAYFKFWEDFWVERVTSAPWFRTKGPYLNFKSFTYSRLLKEDDFIYCREQLNLVKQNVKTDKQKKRAKFFIHSLAEYENKIDKSRSLR